jgi:hypothetical protein
MKKMTNVKKASVSAMTNEMRFDFNVINGQVDFSSVKISTHNEIEIVPICPDCTNEVPCCTCFDPCDCGGGYLEIDCDCGGDEEVCDYCGKPLGFCAIDCETKDPNYQE